jgi:anionic cell wall polymer biosynthesis LytR-Cps2A-Psr (LCP) family protein
MKNSRVDASILVLFAMLLLLLGGGAAVYFTIRVDPMVEALSGDRIVNTLIVVEKNGAPLTSSVLMYYPETKRAALFDVPGELGQIIRSLGRVDRIDVLYNQRSPEAYIQELSSLLGVDIPFYIGIELSDLSKLIDLMEGIEVFISDPVVEYDADPPILLPAGAVALDGMKAITFLEYAIPDEDESLMIARRQRFILSFLKRFGEEYRFLISSQVQPRFMSLLHTNMNNRSFARLYRELAQVDVDRINIQRIQGNLRDVSGKKLLFPFYDGSLIKDIVKQSLSSLARDSDGWSADRVYTVEVLNGTQNQGLARRTADLLQGFGFDTVKIGNAERTDHSTTVVINRTGDEKAGRMLAEVIRCETLRSEPRESRNASETDIGFDEGVDFTLIVGKDFNGRFVVR